MKTNTKAPTIYAQLVSIIERDSEAVYDVLDVLISTLNDKQLEEMEDVIVNQYSEDQGQNDTKSIKKAF